MKRHLTASWSLNTDLGQLLTQFLSLRIRSCTRDQYYGYAHNNICQEIEYKKAFLKMIQTKPNQRVSFK
jgi:hypothetical protein